MTIKTLSKILIMFSLTWAMMLVQMFSNPIVVDKFGERASDLYFYTTLILAFLLNSIVIGIAQIEDNIFEDAIHFSEYRKRTIAKLTKLEYDLGVLDGIDELIAQRQ